MSAKKVKRKRESIDSETIPVRENQYMKKWREGRGLKREDSREK